MEVVAELLGKYGLDTNQFGFSDAHVYVTTSLFCEGCFTEATGIKIGGKMVVQVETKYLLSFFKCCYFFKLLLHRYGSHVISVTLKSLGLKFDLSKTKLILQNL